MRASGFDDVRILRCDKEDGTPGGPAVVARRPAAEGKPTVLLYAHHDVQPTSQLALWETDPFTAVERTAGSSAAVPPMTRPALPNSRLLCGHARAR